MPLVGVVRHLSSVPAAPVAEAARPSFPSFWLATPEPLPTEVGTAPRQLGPAL